MNFLLSEEQQQLADSVRRVIDKDYDFESRKKIVASAEGYSPAVWNTFAELGLTALAMSEEHGGFGRGAMDLFATLEAFGAGLVVEPFLSTVVAGRLIDLTGSDAQRAVLIPGIADGSLKATVAHYEAEARYDTAHVATTARAQGNGWVLDGAKSVVLHAPIADKLIVSARTSGAAGEQAGISLFVVDAHAAGVTHKSFRTQDSMRASDLVLSGVQVGADALLGTAGTAFEAIDEALDFASVLICAEAVGAMKFGCDTTLEYLKTRKQFGVNIGAFQALQHRMVDMCVSTQQARSITLLACSTIDGGASAAERRRVVSAARVKVADAARHIGQEAIQMHGGMGLTIEMKVSHTFKRLTMVQQQFGDADYFLERFAAAA